MRKMAKACALGLAGALVVATLPATLATNAQAATVIEQEPNGTAETANVIAVGDTVNGTFLPPTREDYANSWDKDYYKFDVTKAGPYTVTITSKNAIQGELALLDLDLSNAANNNRYETLSASGFDEFGGTWHMHEAGTASVTYAPLPVGTYYLECDYLGPVTKEQPYSLTVTRANLGTQLKSVKAGKKSFTASWAKASGAASYQIRYTPEKTYKKSRWKKAKKAKASAKKTSVTVKKLKSKTKYKVQLRVVYEVGEDSTNVYSGWSSTKTVKAK